MIYAPFTPDQVQALQGYQNGSNFHPYTCPNRGDGKHRPALVEDARGRTITGEIGLLVPTVDELGWMCPYCEYRQPWAHGFSTVLR